MTKPSRRSFIQTGAAAVFAAALPPANRVLAAADRAGPRQRPNILYALSTGSWGRVTKPGEPLPLGAILDETAAAGFNGVRLTGFPDILRRNGWSLQRYADELEARGLKFSTVSFGGPYYDRQRQPEIMANAREMLAAHQRFGAKAAVFFPPGVAPASEESAALRESFRFMNQMGKMAVEEFGVRMGLHNHTDSLIESQAQVDRFLEGTDPQYVFCAWDSAHLHVGGCDVLATYRKSIDRLVYTDFKDATRKPVAGDYLSPNGERFAGDSHQGKFFNSMLELGRGEIDFPALMRMLADRRYQGWINHDLDTIRVSTADSWRISMDYVRQKLDPIYE